MAASIIFLAGEDIEVNQSSGLAFMGSSFGSSVAVGSFQDRTFISSSNGSVAGPEVDNCKYISSSGVVISSTGSGIHLKQLPNYLVTLNIRFTNDTAVQTANTRVYGYDRVSTNNSPSGVTLYSAQVIHPSLTQVMNGSGSAAWVQLTGSGSYLSMVGSPGTSGFSPNGTGTTSVRHDYYVCLSASPNSVGAKTQFGLAFSLEYL